MNNALSTARPVRGVHLAIPRLAGGLLLLAAALKIYGFGADPVVSTGVFSAPSFQFLVVAFEIALGGWLLWGVQPIGSWMIAMFTFSGFAWVSFYQWWIGQASCGCLGNRVHVNPGYMFLVDVAALSVLAYARPDLQPLWDHRARIRRVGAVVGGCYLLMLGALAVFANYQYGSIDAALAALRFERLSISPALLDMGEGVPNEKREATLELTNRTGEPIRLIGGTADCSCTVLADLPVTIPPGESRSVTIRMRLPRSAGIFTRRAELSLDDQGFRKVGFRLTGRIYDTP